MFVSYRFALLRSLGILGAVLAMLALSGVHPAHGQVTITVNNLSDDDIHNNNNCTLREAIEAANTNTKVDQCMGQGGGLGDVIEFTLGNGTPEIDIGTTMLPDIAERVKIKGNSGGADKVLVHGPGGNPVSGDNGFTIDGTAAGTEIDDMVINRFQGDGVLVLADEVKLLGDYIGTDPTGQFAFSNQGFGVDMHGNGDQVGTSDNASCPYACSVIAGNHMANVVFNDSASGGRVEGSYIGTDATGEAVMPGLAVNGVIDNGKNDTIGGTDGTTPDGSYCSGDCNIIVGDPQMVLVTSAAMNSVVEGNYIGLDGARTFRLNGTTDSTWGVWTVADGTRIGGTSTAARNFIAGATQANVYVGGGHNTVVEGNYVGINANGTRTITGAAWGVQVAQALGTEIGGTTAGTPNVIGGAAAAGVDIYQSTGIQVQGNYIGTAPDGVTHLSNANYGVEVEQGSSDSLIGGTTEGSGNTIAFNVGDGVLLNNNAPLVHDNTIRRNSIFSNHTGIGLIAGANDGIMPPTISAGATLSGMACANCAVEIFSDAGNEGKKFEGVVLANNAGDWMFNGPVSGPNVTATATDVSNNTSEFSAPVVVSTPTPSPSPSPTPTASPSGSHIQGNVNSDGFVDDIDFDYLLEYVAGLNDGMTSGCYTFGDANAPGGYAWGDLNCDGHVNAVDALYLLAKKAGITLTPVGQGCTPIGSAFS